ncbi:hypothetical protein GCM10027214_20790 [Stenotrophomonas tumulicola]
MLPAWPDAVVDCADASTGDSATASAKDNALRLCFDIFPSQAILPNLIVVRAGIADSGRGTVAADCVAMVCSASAAGIGLHTYSMQMPAL